MNIIKRVKYKLRKSFFKDCKTIIIGSGQKVDSTWLFNILSFLDNFKVKNIDYFKYLKWKWFSISKRLMKKADNKETFICYKINQWISSFDNDMKMNLKSWKIEQLINGWDMKTTNGNYKLSI